MKPTIGRIVYVIPPGCDGTVRPAIITKVWSDDCINVVVFDCQKEPHAIALTSCTRAIDDQGKGELKEGPFWAWPPRT